MFITESIREAALALALLHGNETAQKLLEAKQFNCIALTVFAEARGEGPNGMALVAQSMLNRHRIQNKSGCQIARSAYDGYRGWVGKNPARVDAKRWSQAQTVSAQVLLGQFNLGRCQRVTHFLNPSALPRLPGWASAENRICRVGKHIGYKVHKL